MAAQTHAQTHAFAQQAQTLALAWLDHDPSTRLPSVWAVIRHIPRGLPDEDRVVVALVIRAVAGRFCGSIPFAVPIDTRLRWHRAPDVNVVRALEIALRRFGDPTLRLATIARQMHLSSSYLSGLVSRVTGYGMTTHLRLIRLLHATDRLAGTPLTIKEVAAACGYASTSELDTEFRTWFGMTPGEFRHWTTSLGPNFR